MLTDFVLAFPDETLADVAAQLPLDRTRRRAIYLLIDAGDSTYVVARWDEVERLAHDLGVDAFGLALEELAGMPPPSTTIERDSLDPAAAEALRRQQPGGRLVVLVRGSLVGLLAQDPPPAEPTPPDPFELLFEQAKGIDFTPSFPPESELEEIIDARVVNVWVENLGPEAPLEVGVAYGLAFDVDLPRADARLTAGGIAELVEKLRPDQEQFEILVVIESDDFKISGDSEDTLVVPRVGRSLNQAVFDITPLHEGLGIVKALLLANNRVFQKLTISLRVGANIPAAFDTRRSGLTLGSALAQPDPAQLVNLMIIKKNVGYEFILGRGGISRATLNLSETQVAELVAYARRQLKTIVYTRAADGRLIYQQPGTTISLPEHQQALKALAKPGYYLYQKLFYAPGNGPDAQAMGALLRQLSQHEQLTVRIVSERFVFPWGLLYDRDPLDLNQVDPEGFWGFKHIVEYLPEFNSATPVNFIPQLQVVGSLSLSFVCNTAIDQQLGRPIVAGQRDFLAALPQVTLSEHPTCQDLYDLLGQGASPVQLIYAYCHAESFVPGEAGGVGASRLLLSDGAVALDDLNIFAPTHRPPLRQAPLVFLNACQSAELSPYLYDGLVPYLIARGARGVIGTEVDTPALFAAEFAQEFLRRLLAGDQTLGHILLDLRREYCLQRNNVMGLLYALYSSGDITVRWAA